MTNQLQRSLRLFDPLEDFQLLDPTGTLVDTSAYRGLPALLIAFVDNSSPSCRGMHAALAKLAWAYGRRAVGVLAVNPSTASGAVAESPAAMLAVAAGSGLMVPYLMDAKQKVAKAFGVRRLPDFFVFNGDRRLVYHGRFDGRPEPPGSESDGAELRRALDLVLVGEGVPVGITSMGEPVEWVSEVGHFGAAGAGAARR